jgi:hypothetical protein
VSLLGTVIRARALDTVTADDTEEEVQLNGPWSLIAVQEYDAECPAGGHDAAWASHLFARQGSQYECRTVVTVDCEVCP